LKGTASAIVEGIERTVREGGSLHVPKAAKYQLANLGTIPLEIIEVRTDKAGNSNEGNVPRPQVASDLNRSKAIRAVAAVVQ